jgi:flagellar biosynthesis/type III secretory pathway protein FliH
MNTKTAVGRTVKKSLKANPLKKKVKKVEAVSGLRKKRNRHSLRTRNYRGTYNEGFDKGYDDGYTRGFSKGFEDGFEKQSVES